MNKLYKYLFRFVFPGNVGLVVVPEDEGGGGDRGQEMERGTDEKRQGQDIVNLSFKSDILTRPTNMENQAQVHCQSWL